MKNTGNSFVCYTDELYTKFIKLLLHYNISNTTPAIAPLRKTVGSEIVIGCREDMRMIIQQMKKEYRDIDVLGHNTLKCNNQEAFDWLVSFIE